MAESVKAVLKRCRQLSDSEVIEVVTAACRNGRLDLVELLAENNPDICLEKIRDKRCKTLLHYACEEGCYEIIDYLITKHGCKLDARDNNDKTPLHSTSDIDVVQKLIPLLPNYKPVSNDHYHEVLFFACKVGHMVLLKKAMFSHPGMIALNIRDRDQRSPLHHACIGGHAEIVRYLALYHSSLNIADKYNLTPLHYAILYGYKGIVRICRKHYDSVSDSFVEQSRSRMKTADEAQLSKMLFFACEVGHLGVVKYMVEGLKFDPNIANEFQHTLLHIACQNHNILIVEYIVCLPSCTPDSSDKEEVLLLACEAGNLPLLKILIEDYQWNPNVTSEDQQSPIYVACLSGHYDIVNYLLLLPSYKPANDEYLAETLLRACKEKHLDTMKVAVEQGKCDPVRLRDRFQRTLLHGMCQYGQMDMVQYLIEKCGCDPHVRDEARRTPLHSASLSGHAEIVKYLMSQQNSDVNIRNLFQRTPLHYACLKGNMDVALCLTDNRKCHPGVGDKHQRTPLHFACQSGHIGIVHHLIHQKGCLPQVKDEYGRTPLHYACHYGHNDIIEYLISRKCKTDVKDKDHNTPLHCVCYKNRFNSVKCLLKVSDKLSINAENNKKMTPFEMIQSNTMRHDILHLLFQNRSLTDEEIIQLMERFIKRGQWDPNQTDKDGQNALHFACRAERKGILRYLLTKTNCNVNSRDNNGELPPMLARSHDTVITLVQHGADVHGHHNIVLANWAEEEIIQIMTYLVQHNLWDPNQMYDGANALHFACKANKPLIANFLLSKAGCSPSERNSTGQSPLQLTQLPDIMIDLITHGADTREVYTKLFSDTQEELALRVIKGLTKLHRLWNPSQTTDDGDTALHHASMESRPMLVHFLLAEMKCDPNVKNRGGMTPLDLTSNTVIISHLVQHGADPENVYRKLTYTMTEEIGLEAVKYLITRCELYQRTNEDDTILHFACRAKQPRIVHYLLCETTLDLNANNKHGECPLHSMHVDIANIIVNATERRALEVVVHIMRCQTDHLNGMYLQGMTALHLACQFNKTKIASYLLSEANYSPNIVSRAGETPLDQAGDPKIINELIRHGANPSDVYKMHGRVLGRKCQPLKPSVKVFIVGNPSVGKSTLVAAIQTEVSFITRPFRSKMVSSVGETTTGVVPHDFESKRYQCGPVTLYDFAGQREFYSSHTALLQAAVQSTPPVFLLLVNLCDTESHIKQDMQFWLSFISNPCASVDSKPHIIVIGSHADIFTARGGDPKQIGKSIMTHFSNNGLLFSGFVAMDCRYFESAEMTVLGDLLRKSCDNVRRQEPISFNSHCFLTFLLRKFQDRVAVELEDVRSLLMSNNILTSDMQLCTFIPTNLQSLSGICNDLNDRGHILFLKDRESINRSWIILKKAALLTEVIGTIFAPESFKEHCQLASSTGVVPLSKLTNHFPGHNPKMLVGFLSHFEYCHEIADEAVLQLIDEHQRNVDTEYLSNERYFFFPGLITLNIPEKVWEPNHNQFNHISGWTVRCIKPQQFFTSRFLQVLILRLAFYFALAPSEKEKDDSFPAIQRRCSVWRSGIFWGNRDGIEVLVELQPSNKVMILLIRGRESSLFKYVQLRSLVIKKIKNSLKELCKQLETQESLLDPSETSVYPMKQMTTFSMAEIAKSIILSSDCPSVVTTTGATKSIGELLVFEPYASLGGTILHELCINCTGKISDGFTCSFASQVTKQTEIEMFTKMFAEDSKKQPLLDAFQSWREKTVGTYQLLQEKLDQCSIFSLEDVSELVGVLPENSPSVADDMAKTCGGMPCKDQMTADGHLNLKPKLQELQVLKRRGMSVRVVDHVAPQWEQLAMALGFKHHTIATVGRDYAKDAKGACHQILFLWLEETEEGLIEPVTWATLIQCLVDVELSCLAEELNRIFTPRSVEIEAS